MRFLEIIEEVNSEIINSELSRLKDHYKDLADIILSYTPNAIILNKIVAKKDAPKGTGTSFMNKLCAISDQYGIAIALSPAPRGSFKDQGSGYKETESNKKLVDFYKRFDFKKNSDFRIAGKMVRFPKQLDKYTDMM